MKEDTVAQDPIRSRSASLATDAQKVNSTSTFEPEYVDGSSGGDDELPLKSETLPSQIGLPKDSLFDPKILKSADDPVLTQLDPQEIKTLLALISKMKLIESSQQISVVEPVEDHPVVELKEIGIDVKLDEENEKSIKVEIRPSIYEIPMPMPDKFKTQERSSHRILNRVGFVVCNLGILAILEEWSRQVVLLCLADGNWSRVAILGMMPFVWFFTIFVINCLWGALLCLFGPLHQLKQNSPFYSVIPPNITKENKPERLSTVMIQVPVYKEHFELTIKPTLNSALDAAKEYHSHGGNAFIFVNDDGLVYLSEAEKKERVDFYNANGIAFVARPPNEVLKRRGCFKKASNMNFGLGAMMSTKEIYESFKQGKDIGEIQVDESMTESQQKDSILLQLAQRDQFLCNKFVEICDYILLLDSDSRVPHDCILPVTVELNDAPGIAFTQHLTYMMSITGDYWEKLVSHFTNRINQNAILLSTACGETSPFMGHNAFLRMESLMAVSFIDKKDGKRKIWSENRVSEDFDLAIRFFRKNLMGRYIVYGKGFEEGVALVVRDEITRIQKYAYGCSEVLCNRITNIHKKGLIGTPVRKMLGSKVQLATKYNILCYIGTFMALASSPVLAMLNYWLWYIGSYHSTNSIAYSWLAMLIIFGVITPVGCVAMSYRTGMKPRILREMTREVLAIIGMGIFWSGISFHVMVSVWQYLLGIKPQWGATTKEVVPTDFWSELKKTVLAYKAMYVCVLLSSTMIVVMALAPPPAWRITDFSAWFPLAFMTAMHAIMPLLLNPALMLVFY